MQYNVSLAVIVKNSDDVLGTFFEWAIDNFPEVNMVVDTKNDDMTESVVATYKQKYPDQINLKFCQFDNFSAQKQRAINMCTKPFCLLMDADEIMVEIPDNGIEKFMNATQADVGVLDRYNLQKDDEHYNAKGFPDRQFRVIRMSSGIKMDGKVVDETLGMTKETNISILPWACIHYGHIRNTKSLLLKGQDRKPFAADDGADGKGLNEHGENWFIFRNIEWNKGSWLKEVPLNVLIQNRRYWDDGED